MRKSACRRYAFVKYPELLKKAWGWDKLVPYESSMNMRTFKTYLKQYYMHNVLCYLVVGNVKPEEWPVHNAAAAAEQSVSTIRSCNGEGLTNVAEVCLEVDKHLTSL